MDWEWEAGFAGLQTEAEVADGMLGGREDGTGAGFYTESPLFHLGSPSRHSQGRDLEGCSWSGHAIPRMRGVRPREGMALGLHV